MFAVKLGCALSLEYIYRFSKHHACSEHIIWLFNNVPGVFNFKKSPNAYYGLHGIPQCMPPEHHQEDPILAYQSYYKTKTFAKWTKGVSPNSIIEMSEVGPKKMKCSICKQEGHNKRSCKTMPFSAPKIEAETDVKMPEDTYTKDLLKEQYALHKAYVNGRIQTTKKIGVEVRLPCIPEDISENIVKFILHNKLKDTTSRWDCKKGDLQSEQEGKQECKCFTSDGPSSFTPSSEWDVIYFLDARNWLNDKFILYRVLLKRTSSEWKNIKVSKAQTFEDQTKQGRRPRITWESLKPQISSYCNNVYDGTFDDIFNPLEARE